MLRLSINESGYLKTRKQSLSQSLFGSAETRDLWNSLSKPAAIASKRRFFFVVSVLLASDVWISKRCSTPGKVGRKNGAFGGAFGGSLGLFRCWCMIIEVSDRHKIICS